MMIKNRRTLLWLLPRISLLFLLLFSTAFAMNLAITVDDIPANGKLPPNLSRLQVTQQMLTILNKHHIQGIYGLMNGEGIVHSPDGLAIANEWLQAGQLLGDHTFSHLDLARTNSTVYIEDIRKNQTLLQRLMGSRDYHYFRYPYLAEGNTLQKHNAVRTYLFKEHYKIAPVTVDFFDYEWNDAYVRCFKKKDMATIDWLKQSYLEQAANALTISHTLSMQLFHRDIDNVLLIHMNAFSTLMLDDLLTTYEKHKVTFISLPQALEDKVYAINPNVAHDRAYTFLNQVRLSRGLANPALVSELYATLPEDKLNNLCL